MDILNTVLQTMQANMLLVYIAIGTLLYLLVKRTNPRSKYLDYKFVIALVLISVTTYLAFCNNLLGEQLMTGNDVTWIYTLVGAGYNIANFKSLTDGPIIEDKAHLSRKFLVSVIITLSATVLTNYGRMDSTNALIAMGISGGMYGFVNVRQTHKA
jgi:hypothetical protein